MALTPSRRRYIHISVGVAVSCLFLYLAFKGEDWPKIIGALKAANYLYMLPIAAVSYYTLFVRAQRWRVLLVEATGNGYPLLPIVSATSIGFMANLLLPLRAGEVVRPLLLTRSTGTPVSTAFATAVLERLLDMIAVLVLLVVVVLFSGVSPAIKTVAIYAGVFGAAGLTVVFLVHRHRDRVLPVIDVVWHKLPDRIAYSVIRLEHEFLDAVASIAPPRVLMPLVGWSVYLWLMIALTFYLGTLALDIDVGFVGGGMAVATIVALAVALPSAPGFVGVWQVGCTTALAMYGISGTEAAGYSLFSHAAAFVSQLSLGLVFLLREGLSFTELDKMQEKAPSSAPESV